MNKKELEVGNIILLKGRFKAAGLAEPSNATRNIQDTRVRRERNNQKNGAGHKLSKQE